MPIIEIDGTDFEGLCTDCEQTFGTQTGEIIRLAEPGRRGQTEVMFMYPADNAIRIRYCDDGSTEQVDWSKVERPFRND